MEITHGPAQGHHHRRLAVVAGVVLAGLAIVLPFGISGLDHDGAHASSGLPGSGTGGGTTTTARHSSGSQGVAHTSLRPGLQVRVGNVTIGTLHHSTSHGWQVVVLWSGRRQALPLRGPVTLGASSWVDSAGRLHTRSYVWKPRGGSAYTVPTLVAVPSGQTG
jgi:hypothetical protein